jgi:hypothetical protein
MKRSIEKRFRSPFERGKFMASGIVLLCLLLDWNTPAQAAKKPTSVTAEKMMGYLPKHLEKILPYSWDHPQRWLYMRKRRAYTDKDIDLLCQAAKVITLQESPREFEAKYPDRLYSGAYMNLEKDYGSKGLKKGHFAAHPEQYLYKPDGQPVVGDECPYYNLMNPEMREWWLDEAERQLQADGAGPVLFIDALGKALDIGGKGSSVTDSQGTPVGADYREKALKPLLAAVRDRFSEKYIITGNFLRANRPGGNLPYVLDYLHCAYIESFERLGGGYVENAHRGIEYIQEAVDAGKMIELTMSGDKKPTPCPEMSLDEKREKARQAMPEFWKKIGSKEQDELAEIYAYFDFKLAMFLMAAGEHSYFKYAVEPLGDNAGTDLFKNVQPFPEWDMPLGPPLEKGKRQGDVWRRKFKHVEVVLDLGKGTCQFNKR